MPILYPSLNHLGIIGDRRTAGMVSADGTLCWFCLPNYNGGPVFGSLLDSERGGHWRLGPKWLDSGEQSYQDDSAVLVTRWVEGGDELEVTDFMPWPENRRPSEQESSRTIIRRVHAVSGTVECNMELVAKHDFQPVTSPVVEEAGAAWNIAGQELRLWSSASIKIDGARASFQNTLQQGQEVWLVLQFGGNRSEWSIERASEALEDTVRYWHDWSKKLAFTAPRRRRVMQAAKLVHLLSFAPAGSLVAAPTTSLPERIGGQRNYDYRYAWLRDASLSLASLSMLGDIESSAHYMDWLVTLGSEIDAPLQPLYQIDGNSSVPQSSKPELFGYRGSQPVLIGNHAYQQYQPDSYGYFAECALIYLQHGGLWKDEYWHLLRRLADHIAHNWQLPSHGIWELSDVRHYVSSKVTSWVTLDRAIKVVDHLEMDFDVSEWQHQRDLVHDDVMTHGWSDSQHSFLEHYEGEQLDASALLIPVMDFLPAKNPQVLSTLQKIDEQLTIKGLVHRFDPRRTLGKEQPPLGTFEGAFLPATFLMASAYAKAGMTEQAESILETVERATDETGLLSEEIDARSLEFLGNTPLIFSLVEYIRAVMELDKAKPLNKAALMVGMAKNKLSQKSRGFFAK